MMTPERIAELRAALDAESISYGELMEIDEAFEQIDPSTLPEPAENAMAEDRLDEIEMRLNGCPHCGSGDIVSQERTTTLYHVIRRGGEVRYDHTLSSETLDDGADPYGLYCRNCDHEWSQEIVQ